MLPFGIGIGEVLLILVVLLLVVGPKKLPEVAKTVGKGVRTIRRAGQQLRDSVEIEDIKRTVYGEPTRAWKQTVDEVMEVTREPPSVPPPPPPDPYAAIAAAEALPEPAPEPEEVDDGRPVPRTSPLAAPAPAPSEPPATLTGKVRDGDDPPA